MAGINKALLIGHVGRAPEIKYTTGGTAVANFSVATSENYKDKSGKDVEKTEWHRIVCFGRVAEVMGEYLKKGQQVFIEGKIQTRSWDGDDGKKRYMTEINAFSVQFLGKRGDGTRPNGGDEPAYDDNDTSTESNSKAQTDTTPASESPSEEDLPF